MAQIILYLVIKSPRIPLQFCCNCYVLAKERSTVVMISTDSYRYATESIEMSLSILKNKNVSIHQCNFPLYWDKGTNKGSIPIQKHLVDVTRFMLVVDQGCVTVMCTVIKIVLTVNRY